MRRITAVCLSALLLFPIVGSAQNAPTRAAQPAGSALSAATREKLIASMNKGAAYLVSQQKPDGTWENNAGISAMAAGALLRQPGKARDEAMRSTGKTLDYLRGLAKPDGGIYDKAVPHYVTAVSVMALVAGGRSADKPAIEKGRQYIAEHLLDEGEGLKPSDKFYGANGYGAANGEVTGDIISLEFALRAMKEAGTGANDPAWNKAIQFLQRTQNNSETNDQSWAANDGGFIYLPGNSEIKGTTRSYGSGTYAGIMSYAWANVKKSDDRVQSALKWIRQNYTLDENPGLGQKTLYYYYMVFAKALQAVDEGAIVDARGQRHNWREDLANKLIALQNAEGYWVNTDPAEMQNNKVLVTAFTLMAIEATLQ